MNMAEVREQYPQYEDLSDAELAKGLHSKFYGDLPFEEFANKIGLQSEESEPQTLAGSSFSSLGLNLSADQVGTDEERSTFAKGMLRQTAQGATLGFADEGEARIVSMLSNKTYKQARDEIRELNAEFSEENPNTALAANIVGGGLTGGAGLLKGVGMSAAKSAGQRVAAGSAIGSAEGSAAGLGFSDAETANELLSDTAQGGGAGLLLGGLGGGVLAALKHKAANNLRLQKALEGEPDSRVVQAMVKGGEKAGASKSLVDASKQGFDDGVLHVLLGASDADKKFLREMTDIHEKALYNPKFARTNRASNIVGESIKSRYKYVSHQRSAAGLAIDKASSKLAGQDVGQDKVIGEFLDDLDIAGVQLGEKGLEFKGSDYASFPASQSLIKKVFREAATVNDAQSAHKFKRTIDKLVSYGKSNQRVADSDAIGLVKNLRREIDGLLDGFSPEYDEANIAYRKATEALGEIDSLVGKSSRADSPNFSRTLGTLSNRISSRASSGGRVDDAFNLLDKTAAELGGEFSDDFTTLSIYADELDRMFGGTQQNSLQGQTKTAISLSNPKEKIKGAITDKAADLLNKAGGRNDENAFKSIRDLLKE